MLLWAHWRRRDRFSGQSWASCFDWLGWMQLRRQCKLLNQSSVLSGSLFYLFNQLIKSLKCIKSDNLKYCSLAGCKDITDFGFQKFTSQCPNLETLDISGCFQITDSSVKFLAFSCKFLIDLNLNGCKMVTNLRNANIT